MKRNQLLAAAALIALDREPEEVARRLGLTERAIKQELRSTAFRWRIQCVRDANAAEWTLRLIPGLPGVTSNILERYAEMARLGLDLLARADGGEAIESERLAGCRDGIELYLTQAARMSEVFWKRSRGRPPAAFRAALRALEPDELDPSERDPFEDELDEQFRRLGISVDPFA